MVMTLTGQTLGACPQRMQRVSSFNIAEPVITQLFGRHVVEFTRKLAGVGRISSKHFRRESGCSPAARAECSSPDRRRRIRAQDATANRPAPFPSKRY